MGNKSSNTENNTTNQNNEIINSAENPLDEKKNSKTLEKKFSVNWISENGQIIKIKQTKPNSAAYSDQNEPSSESSDAAELQKLKNSAHIVIIGAGPVGLWTSILLKQKNPSLNILIYERHTEYIRSNNIKLPKGEKFEVPNFPKSKASSKKKK